MFSYVGTFWSHDACFTPARTDQLCQLVAAEERTSCSALAGTGKRKVRVARGEVRQEACAQVMQCPISTSDPLQITLEPT